MDVNYFAIISSILIIFLKRFSSKICQNIQSILFIMFNKKDSFDLNGILNEIKLLKNERDSFNPMDEFAKYALVDRKISKLMDTMQIQKNKVRSKNLANMMYIKGVYTFLISIMSIALIYVNYDKPVIDFSGISNNETNENIFYPMSLFLSFPCKDRSNALGVTAWLFVLNRSIDIFINKINLLTSKQKIN